MCSILSHLENTILQFFFNLWLLSSFLNGRCPHRTEFSIITYLSTLISTPSSFLLYLNLEAYRLIEHKGHHYSLEAKTNTQFFLLKNYLVKKNYLKVNPEMIELKRFVNVIKLFSFKTCNFFLFKLYLAKRDIILVNAT